VKISRPAQLKDAIEYPDPVPADATSFVFRVDGNEIEAVEVPGGALRLLFRLEADVQDLPRLADWAAGRILRDEATLSVTSSGQPFLWQEVPATADAAALRRAFETFLDACDWWIDRLEDRTDGQPVHFSEVLIRP